MAHVTSDNLKLNETYVRRLTSVKNADSVEGLRREFDERRILRLGCRLQIERGLVPVSCYPETKAERQKLGPTSTGVASARFGIGGSPEFKQI